MSHQAPATMPGTTPVIDEQARLRCPRCNAPSVTVTATDTDPNVAWTNHAVTCQSCHTTTQLAVVSAFGQVVIRWLSE
ncbi:hypothetical protein [Cellulomonas biazotea]